MSKREPSLLVEDIIESANKVLDYSIVWEIKDNYLPSLIAALKSL